MADQPAITYTYPMYNDFIAPKGALTLDPACHACFYYGMLARQSILAMGGSNESQMLLYKVGDREPESLEARLDQIARSVATIYQLESPDDFLKYRKEAWVQAKVLGIELDARIFSVSPGKILRH